MFYVLFGNRISDCSADTPSWRSALDSCDGGLDPALLQQQLHAGTLTLTAAALPSSPAETTPAQRSAPNSSAPVRSPGLAPSRAPVRPPQRQ